MKKSALTLIEAARYGDHIHRYMLEAFGDLVFEPMDRALSEITHKVDHFCLGLFHASGYKHNLVAEPVKSTGVAVNLEICDATDGQVLRRLRVELTAAQPVSG